MKQFKWPYSSHDRQVFMSKFNLAENYMQKYGAKYIGKVTEFSSWIVKDGSYATERKEKNIWKYKEKYIKVDAVYFPIKPFIVLEFSDRQEGPYEDADPFPYDISDEDLEREIKNSLCIE